MCSWCICLVAARLDCEKQHREEGNESDRRKTKYNFHEINCLNDLGFDICIKPFDLKHSFELETELLFMFSS